MAKDIKIEIQWNVEGVIGRLKKDIANKLAVAGEYLRSYIVLSISNPTRSFGPSRPGNPPNADTGKLKQSIFSSVNRRELSVTVGTTLNYGFWLETGTRKMAARPFIRPAMANCRDRVVKILTS